MKYYKHSEGGRTVFMVAGDDANEAITRIGDANVPAGVSYYEKMTVVIVKDAAAFERELQR